MHTSYIGMKSRVKWNSFRAKLSMCLGIKCSYTGIAHSKFIAKVKLLSLFVVTAHSTHPTFHYFFFFLVRILNTSYFTRFLQIWIFFGILWALRVSVGIIYIPELRAAMKLFHSSFYSLQDGSMSFASTDVVCMAVCAFAATKFKLKSFDCS